MLVESNPEISTDETADYLLDLLNQDLATQTSESEDMFTTPVKKPRLMIPDPPPRDPNMHMMLYAYYTMSPFTLEAVARIKFIQIIANMYQDLMQPETDSETKFTKLGIALSFFQEWSILISGARESREARKELRELKTEFSPELRVLIEKYYLLLSVLVDHDIHKYHAEMTPNIIKTIETGTCEANNTKVFTQYFTWKARNEEIGFRYIEDFRLVSYIDMKIRDQYRWPTFVTDLASRENLFEHELIE